MSGEYRARRKTSWGSVLYDNTKGSGGRCRQKCGRSLIKDETAGGSALPTRGRGEDAIVRFSFLSGLLAGGTLQGGRPGLLTSDKLTLSGVRSGCWQPAGCWQPGGNLVATWWQ